MDRRMWESRSGFGSQRRNSRTLFSKRYSAFLRVLGAQASLPVNFWGSEQARMPALPGSFESDSFVDYFVVPNSKNARGI